MNLFILTHRILFILFALVCIQPVSAQQFFDALRVDHLQGFGQTFDSTGTKTPLNETSFDLTIPIQSSAMKEKDLVVLSGLFGDQCNVRLDEGQKMTTFYGLMVKIGIVKKHGNKWRGTYILLPKLNSDFKAIGKHDFQMGAFGLWKYEKSETLNYRLGLYVNADLFGPTFVPFFGVYLLKDKFEINANLPLNADINFRIANKVKIGTRYNGFNKSFNLNWPSPTYLEKATNEIGAYVHLEFGIIHWQLFAGTSFLRNFRTFAIGDQVSATFPLVKIGNDRTQLNTDFSNAMLVKTSIIIRIPTN